MKTNPKTSDEFFSLPIGPEPGREISRGLFPMEEGDILRIDDQSAGISWRVWQYKDGERFRLRLGDY